MFCRRCGNQLSENAKFCGKCGASTVNNEHVKAQPKKNNKWLIFFGVTVSVLLGSILLMQVLNHKNQIATENNNKSTETAQESQLELGKQLLDTEISSPQEAVTLNYETLKITIPEGTVEKSERFIIASVKETVAPIEGLEALTAPMDFSLGNLTSFEKPIVIEIPYDATKLGEFAPKDAFMALYFNESSGKWSDIPYEVDESVKVVRLKMYHFTTVQVYYSKWEGAKVYDDGNSYIIYRNDTASRALYNQYETGTGKVASDPTIPQLVVDAATQAGEIMKAYQDMGLEVSNKPKIYVQDKDSGYNSLTGNIVLSLGIVNKEKPDQLIARDLAHELYHNAQLTTVGMWAYEKSKRGTLNFYPEACADYVACEGLWKALGKAPIGGYKELMFDYFSKSLFTFDEIHEYVSAYFIKYLASQMPSLTPATLAEVIGSSSDMEIAFNQKMVGNPFLTLGSAYESFVEDTLFVNPMYFQDIRMNKWNSDIEIKTKDGTKLELKPDGNGNFENPLIEGKASLQIPEAYSAGFYKFTTDADTTLELSESSNNYLNVYVVNRKTEKGYVSRNSSAGAKSVTVNFASDEYVLVMATGSQKNGEKIDFNYKAMPMVATGFEGQPLDVPMLLNNGIIPKASQYYEGDYLSGTLQLQGNTGTLELGGSMIGGAFSETDVFEFQNYQNNVIELSKNADGSYTGTTTLVYICKSQVNGIYAEEDQQESVLEVTVTSKTDGYEVQIACNGDVRTSLIK